MVRLAYGLTGDQGHAEDVVQAAFARAYAPWPRVRRSADVEHTLITLAGGGTIRVRAILVGDQKFFAFAHGQGQHAVRWQAYDASRREVGSGRFTGL